jgi:hypothetical protein
VGLYDVLVAWLRSRCNMALRLRRSGKCSWAQSSSRPGRCRFIPELRIARVFRISSAVMCFVEYCNRADLAHVSEPEPDKEG